MPKTIFITEPLTSTITLPHSTSSTSHRRLTITVTDDASQNSKHGSSPPSSSSIPISPVAPSNLPHTTTNLGPLTTTFTPASSCNGKLLIAVDEDYNDEDNDQLTLVQFGYARACPTGSSTPFVFPVPESCQPPRYVAAMRSLEATNIKSQVFPVYSPGLHCPVGYETVGGFSRSLGSPPQSVANRLNQFAIIMNTLVQPGEVALVCCPSGYGADIVPHQCFSVYDATESAIVQSCPKVDHAPETFTYSANITQSTASFTAQAIVLIQQWQTPAPTTGSPPPFLPLATGNSKSAASPSVKSSVGLFISIATMFITAGVFSV